MTDPNTPMVREAVAVFKNEKDLQAAADDLLTHGFDHSELSLLASDAEVEHELGPELYSVKQLEDAIDVPTIAYSSTEAIGDAEGAVMAAPMYIGALIGLVPIIAGGGSFLTAFIAMLIGGAIGAVIGGFLARMIDQRHRDYIHSQMTRGGLLLWVRTWSRRDEKRAIEILTAHKGRDVHIHGERALGRA